MQSLLIFSQICEKNIEHTKHTYHSILEGFGESLDMIKKVWELNILYSLCDDGDKMAKFVIHFDTLLLEVLEKIVKLEFVGVILMIN